MKFASLIAVASAVRLSQRQGPPSAADIIKECDTSKNGLLSKKEVKSCIKKHVPKGERAGVDKEVDDMWSKVDTDGSGEVSKEEIEAAMAKHGSLA